MPRLCKVPGCYHKVKAKGLCSKHHQRNRRHGSPYILLQQHRPHRLGDMNAADFADWFQTQLNPAPPLPGKPVEGDCLVWSGYKTALGYGALWHEGKLKKAHRVAWYLKHGEWPNFICHQCDTPACANPHHMIDADPSRNMIDRAMRGRPDGIYRKLMPDDVRGIVAMRKAGMLQRDIADRYGVSIPTVSKILSGRRWQYLTGIGK